MEINIDGNIRKGKLEGMREMNILGVVIAVPDSLDILKKNNGAYEVIFRER